MPSIKERRRAKRRAEKLVEESLDALASGHDALADKLIQRALSAGPANARFWLEYARISQHRGFTRRTERAVRRALELSPDFTEARELLEQLVPANEPMPSSEPVAEVDEPPLFTDRTERFDWDAHADDLTLRGVTRLPSLLVVDECIALREHFAHDEHFEHDVEMNDERGRVRYRFFRRPLPALVSALRSELYARLAPIANRFNELVGDKHRCDANSFAVSSHHEAGVPLRDRPRTPCDSSPLTLQDQLPAYSWNGIPRAYRSARTSCTPYSTGCRRGPGRVERTIATHASRSRRSGSPTRMRAAHGYITHNQPFFRAAWRFGSLAPAVVHAPRHAVLPRRDRVCERPTS